MTNELPSFNENYKTLRDIAEALTAEEQKDVPDIDNLLHKVEEATAAYKACKIRLDAVEEALAELQQEEEQPGE